MIIVCPAATFPFHALAKEARMSGTRKRTGMLSARAAVVGHQ